MKNIFNIRLSGSLRNSPLFRGAFSILHTLKQAGFHAWIVGGAPRDLILGIPPHDLDITCDARPEELLQLFPDAHPIGAAFGILTIVRGQIPYEVASLREERDYLDGRHPETVLYTSDPELDVLRRDFTVNSLLLDPDSDAILDFTGGVDDLKRGLLRTVGDPVRRFSEDYLRILRAVRFLCRLNFTLDPAAADAIRSCTAKLSRISAERIRDELDKILTGPRPADAFEQMSALGILPVIFPELERLRGVEQPVQYHPEGDVFQHTMLMLRHMVCPSRELGWSILLHDIGKPDAQFFRNDGIPRFYNHESIGADLAAQILPRFKMPSLAARHIVQAVRNHMRFASVHQMRPAKLRRLIADDNFALELELHRIDCISSNFFMDNYVLLLDTLHELSSESGRTSLPPPFVTGSDLIALGMRPGPALGALLHTLMDRQLDGHFPDRSSALAFARQSITTPQSAS